MLNHKKTEKILLIILEALIYVSFLMPFIYVSRSIFPFIVGKILFFQALVQFMAVIYILLLFINFKQYKPRKSVLLYWFGFYAVSLLLSAIFGVDFDRAFWSNFERMSGVFVVWHFIAYAIILSVVLDTWPKIRRAIQVLLGVSLLQVAVVAAQYMKEGVFLYPGKGGRIWGTLGNSIYIGSYFLFHIFFALLLAFKEKKNQFLQIVYLIIAAVEAYIIVHSKSSRGADIALLFGLVMIFFGYTLLSKNKKIRLAVIVFLVSGIIALGGCFVFRNSQLVQKIPVVSGLTHVSFQEGTGRTRAIAWEIGFKVFKDYPVFGLGLENFYYGFNTHYNPESLLHSYYETWFDRSHSVIFDTLASGGAIGFIAYFGLFVVGGVALVVAWRKKIVDKHILIFFFIIFSTFLIQVLFVFEHPGSYLLIYFSFGLLLSVVSEKKEYKEAKYNFTPSSFFVVGTILLVLFFILFFGTSVRTYKAAVGIIDAERVFVQNYRMGLEAYREVLSMKTPMIDDMRGSLAKRVLKVPSNILEQQPNYKEAILFAREELLKQINKNPIDVYEFILLGQTDTLLATADPTYLDSAERFFERAAELSPKRQQIYYTWGKTKIMRNDIAGAIELMKKTIEFEPRVADSYWYLGLIYDRAGESELVWDNLLKAVDHHYVWKSSQELEYLIGVGERMKKYEGLPRFYLRAIELNPDDQRYYGGLGNVYLRLGKRTLAFIAQKLASLDKSSPDFYWNMGMLFFDMDNYYNVSFHYFERALKEGYVVRDWAEFENILPAFKTEEAMKQIGIQDQDLAQRLLNLANKGRIGL